MVSVNNKKSSQAKLKACWTGGIPSALTTFECSSLKAGQKLSSSIERGEITTGLINCCGNLTLVKAELASTVQSNKAAERGKVKSVRGDNPSLVCPSLSIDDIAVLIIKKFCPIGVSPVESFFRTQEN